jgi:Ca2+-transporting ATPase
VPVRDCYRVSHWFKAPLARTLAFVSLVVGNVALIFAIRVLPQSGSRADARWQNRYLWIVLGVTGVALLLLMTVSALARLFGLVALLNLSGSA